MTADAGVASPFGVAGKSVLVVGGTRGIGRAIALQLARGGARVIVNYVRERGPADALVAEGASAGLSIEAVRADVTSDKGREELGAFVGERFAQLSTLVFAAATGVHKPLAQLSARHFDFTFGLNVKAFLALVQLFLPRLQAGSTIIALSSEGADRAVPQYTLVGSSKGALEAMARHMAAELAPGGIRVNVLSPGTVQTDAWNALPDAERRLRDAVAKSPSGRLTQLDEVALAAQFLASDASAGILGQTLIVDGGARIVGSG
jgi:enoyl-[acyl-carrier protein] reductase III